MICSKRRKVDYKDKQQVTSTDTSQYNLINPIQSATLEPKPHDNNQNDLSENMNSSFAKEEKVTNLNIYNSGLFDTLFNIDTKRKLLLKNFLFKFYRLAQEYTELGASIIHDLPEITPSITANSIVNISIEINDENDIIDPFNFFIRPNSQDKNYREIKFVDTNYNADLEIIRTNPNTNFRIFIDKSMPNIKNLCVEIILAFFLETTSETNELKVQYGHKNKVTSQPELLIFLNYLNSQDPLKESKITRTDKDKIKQIFTSFSSILEYMSSGCDFPYDGFQNFVMITLEYLLEQKTIADQYNLMQQLEITKPRLGVSEDKQKKLQRFTFFLINYKENEEVVINLSYDPRYNNYRKFILVRVFRSFCDKLKILVNNINYDHNEQYTNFLKKIPDTTHLSFFEEIDQETGKFDTIKKKVNYTNQLIAPKTEEKYVIIVYNDIYVDFLQMLKPFEEKNK